MSEAAVLFGTQLYGAPGEAGRRQARAAKSLLDTSPLRPVNLLFRDGMESCQADGFENVAILELDSNRVTGRRGPRKPIVSEVFTRLAELARDRNVRYFGFTNADILFTPAVVDRVLHTDYPAFLIARTDVDARGTPSPEPLLYGTDVFVIDARWWLENRHGFRPYILGEGCWDNVYSAQLLCRAGGLLLNREPLVSHEMHAVAWRDSPFAEYNGYLAALDRMYFTRWVMYATRLEAMRRQAGGLGVIDDELRLQDEIFRAWKPRLSDRLVHMLRVARLEGRRRFRRRRDQVDPSAR